MDTYVHLDCAFCEGDATDELQAHSGPSALRGVAKALSYGESYEISTPTISSQPYPASKSPGLAELRPN